MLHMNRNFKYRIYPNQAQSAELSNILDLCRNLYNCALEERISFYKKFNKSIYYFNQCKHLKVIQNEFPEYKAIYSQVLQNVLKKVDSAYENFFRRVKIKSGKAGFPRFKNSKSFNSFCFTQIVGNMLGKGGVKLLPNNKIKLHKINGEIKVKWHRPFQGQCKNISIVRELDQWYIVLCCDNVPKETRDKTNKIVGIDVGLTSFVTLDDGTKYHHPRPYKTSKEKLAYKQRRLALKKRGSNNAKKAKLAVAKQHRKIVNIREDFQHKLSNKLVKEFDEIYVEDLDIQNMMTTDKLSTAMNRSIADASWGKFIEKLKYKAENAGTSVVAVPARGTTQTCHRCGAQNKTELKDRVYNCQSCGLNMDRDINSALNIKFLGLRSKPKNGSERPIDKLIVEEQLI